MIQTLRTLRYYGDQAFTAEVLSHITGLSAEQVAADIAWLAEQGDIETTGFQNDSRGIPRKAWQARRAAVRTVYVAQGGFA